MSYRAMGWVASLKGFEHPSDKLLLWQLAYHLNKDSGDCYPSISTLIAETGLSKPTIIAGLQRLCEQGLISRRRTTGKSNFYTLSIPVQESTPVQEIALVQEGTPVEKVSQLPVQKVDQHQCKKLTTNREVTGKNKPVKGERPRGFVPEEVETGEVDLQTFADYQKARKARRAGPVTKTSWARLKREAFKSQISLQEACEMCAARGWASIDSSWETLRKQKKQATPESKLLSATRDDFARKNWTEGLRRMPDGGYTF